MEWATVCRGAYHVVRGVIPLEGLLPRYVAQGPAGSSPGLVTSAPTLPDDAGTQWLTLLPNLTRWISQNESMSSSSSSAANKTVVPTLARFELGVVCAPGRPPAGRLSLNVTVLPWSLTFAPVRAAESSYHVRVQPPLIPADVEAPVAWVAVANTFAVVSSAAFQANVGGDASNLLECEFREDEELTGVANPFSLEPGVKAMASFRGSLVFHVSVSLVMLAVQALIVGYSVKFVLMTVPEALRHVRSPVPSLLTFPITAGIVTGNAVALLSHAKTAGDYVLGATSLIFLLLQFAVIVNALLLQFRARLDDVPHFPADTTIQTPFQRVAACINVLVSKLGLEPRDGRDWVSEDEPLRCFVYRYGVLFDDLDEGNKLWYLFDAAFGFVTGAISGIRPSDRVSCSRLLGALVLVMFFYLGVLVWRRPFRARGANVFTIGITSLTSLGCLLLVVSDALEDRQGAAASAGAWINSLTAIAAAFLSILLLVRSLTTHGPRVRQVVSAWVDKLKPRSSRDDASLIDEPLLPKCARGTTVFVAAQNWDVNELEQVSMAAECTTQQDKDILLDADDVVSAPLPPEPLSPPRPSRLMLLLSDSDTSSDDDGGGGANATESSAPPDATAPALASPQFTVTKNEVIARRREALQQMMGRGCIEEADALALNAPIQHDNAATSQRRRRLIDSDSDLSDDRDAADSVERRCDDDTRHSREEGKRRDVDL